jgi:hypothetical protein
MGTYYNPRIVTDGLVLALDAGNAKSYPGSGTTWTDLSGKGYNGTLTDGPTFSSADGGSIVLDGVNDFVQIPYDSYWDSNVFGTATVFSIECWYKPDVFRDWDTVVMKWNPALGGWYSAPEGASIWSNLAGFQAVFASGVASNPAGSNVILSYSTATLKWYHLCFTGDGVNLRLYVDGIQRSTELVSSRTVAVTTSNNGPTFGRRQFMLGKLSNSRFYTRALNESEIRQNFNATRGRYGI